MRPTVSIVTPARDTAPWLAEAIASVRAQSFQEWEHLIVNDGSVDDTAAVIDRAAGEDGRIRPIHLDSPVRPALARNRALENARGRYIAFLDSDDLWLPDKLERQVAFMRDTEAAFSYTAYYIRREADGSQRMIRPRPRASYRSLLKANIIATSTAMYDREAPETELDKLRLPLIQQRQDLGFWLRLLRHLDTAHCLEEPLTVIRKRAGSLSDNKLRSILWTWRLYRDHERLSLIPRCWYFGNYLVRTTLKHLL
ncbi:glycosyltransferase family 2 protein [Natronospira bacteriovora]|uniref:Glycosyltransferase family 2 protein n=1 Tax=Natronospira bacteriovora TaxID=3069753 RepID=A0ABU0WA31_9GAMM|nr:glycosyltransferase family 2 protein [Natronospira sp. AB-CW4]MDQ2070902.1 glycosyltransferase family 2 protein [Natronospira sp. AB-CW4]